MSDSLKILESQKLQNRLNAVIVLGTIISLAAGAYWYWQTHIKHPKVQVLSVDWDKGTAQVMINGTQQTLYSGTKFSAGAEWAIQFNNQPDGDDLPDRIEVIRGDIVHKVLLTREEKAA